MGWTWDHLGKSIIPNVFMVSFLDPNPNSYAINTHIPLEQTIGRIWLNFNNKKCQQERPCWH